MFFLGAFLIEFAMSFSLHDLPLLKYESNVSISKCLSSPLSFIARRPLLVRTSCATSTFRRSGHSPGTARKGFRKFLFPSTPSLFLSLKSMDNPVSFHPLARDGGASFFLEPLGRSSPLNLSQMN